MSDMAGPALERVLAPTLLIVGSRDVETLEQNRTALRKLPGQKKLESIAGASHQFEEPGLWK